MMKRVCDILIVQKSQKVCKVKNEINNLGKESNNLPVYVAFRGSWVKAWTPP